MTAVETETKELSYADQLRVAADLFDAYPSLQGHNTIVAVSGIRVTLYSPTNARRVIREIITEVGGKWAKTYEAGWDGKDFEATTVVREIKITLNTARKNICEETVTYTCDPILEGDDE